MTSKTTTGTKQVDSYLARLAAPQRETLVVVRDRLRRILPHASEGMKYGMPMFDGRWKWFRRDGTLMRTGQFSLGRQVGTWQTFDAHGTLVKTTRF